MPETAELVIIGGGIVGAATAFYASLAGFRPLLLEAGDELASLTTSRSTGAFRLQFDNKEELDLIRQSVRVFLDFETVTGQSRYLADVRQQGYLWVTTDPERAAYQQDLVARQHAWGQTDIELFDGDEVRGHFPYISPAVVSGRFRAGDGFLDPVAVTLGFAEGSAAEIVTACLVESIQVGPAGVTGVVTSLGSVSTGLVIVCAGPFSAGLLVSAGVDLPVRAVARHKVIMPDVPEVPPSAPMTIDDDTGTHWRPALAGAFLLFTDPLTPATPPTWDVPADPDYAVRILDPSSSLSAARVSPFWEEVWRRRRSWRVESGQYSVTPDHRPLIGPTGVGGLFVNTGYSGHGIMGAPAGSSHLIDLIKGAQEDNPFDPNRDQSERVTDLL